jgi:hypothetical protein
MSFGIHECTVQHDAEDKTRVCTVDITFGDNYHLGLSALDGDCELTLVTKSLTVTLRACGPMCEFERAVNLLRLHMGQR